MRFTRWCVAALLPAALLAAGLGCDSRPAVSSSMEEGTVKGTVTIKGKPATKGQVVFDPANYQRKDVEARSAPIGADGTYTVKTLVGTNSIRVGGPEAEAAGAAYAGFELDVKPGDNTFDITLPRP